MSSITQSSFWSDQGTEPTPGDEVYVAGEQPIAEYDNFFNYAASDDIANLIAKVGGDVDLSWGGVHNRLVSSGSALLEFDGSNLALLQNLDVDAHDVVDSGSVIWDSVAGEIPDSAMGTIANSTLANSSLTYTAGDGLKGGGTVSLGGSATINIEPADFAGSFLSDDGLDNLQVDIGTGLEGDGVGNIRVDEDYDFSFTKVIDFLAGLSVQGDIVDDTGDTIWDYLNSYVPQSVVQQGHNSGLNADTIDGYHGADLGARAENEAISGNWNFTGFIDLDNYQDLGPIAEPTAPSSGDVRLFVDSADNNLKVKDPDGDVVTLMTT